MFKALLHETYTKRDLYGNVYHTVRVTNPKTQKAFTTETPSMGNVKHILDEAFTSMRNYYTTEECTGSARTSSLPESMYLDSCSCSEEWKKALRGIGYRINN